MKETQNKLDAKNGITEKMSENSLKEICKVLAATSESSVMYDYFCCLLTPAECKDIAARWLLVKEVAKGTPQREIASMFNMSLCKITRGSRELQKKDSAFKKMLEAAENLKKR